MTNEEKLAQAIAVFKDYCVTLNMKLDELCGQHISYKEKVPIEHSTAEDVRTILHKLTYTEFLFASFYKRHLIVPSDKQSLDAYTDQIITRYEEGRETERIYTEVAMWEVSQKMEEDEPIDEYESEGYGICPYCHERPCACSNRDN